MAAEIAYEVEQTASAGNFMHSQEAIDQAMKRVRHLAAVREADIEHTEDLRNQYSKQKVAVALTNLGYLDHPDQYLDGEAYQPPRVDQPCLEYPQSFTPEKENARSTEFAKQLCQMCFRKDDCLEEAMQLPGIEGIWGGTDSRQRKKLRRQMTNAS